MITDTYAKTKSYTVYAIVAFDRWNLLKAFGEIHHKNLTTCKEVFEAQSLLRKGFRARHRIVKVEISEV